ncbi:MAG: ROK family transcriptional regulator [Microbacterium sp.]|uniref:ROK family transcriptional regulator n=1 Tax=Microbacterium sp. TaxID=51671 RepID=UPI0039E2E3EA
MAARKPPPGSQTSLREANRARLIDTLKTHGHLTQVELAGMTGLSPATVSNIVRELTAAGVLETSYTSRSGRRAIEVRLARQAGLVAGVHVSTRSMRIAIADVGGTVVSEHSVPLAHDHRHDAELDRVALMLTDMLESLDAEMSDLLSVAIGLPVAVDVAAGVIATPGLLPGWDGVPVAERLSLRLGVPVRVDSDANLGALGEARLGAARGLSTYAYVRVGDTISAGLMVGGEVFRGAGGKAGQLGHVTLDENGPVCVCGSRGCLDAIAGGRALLARFPEDAGIHRVRDVLLRAGRGDTAARRVIADAGRSVGMALADLVNLLDPALVVVGGELAAADELLVAPMRHAMERAVLEGLGAAPDVVVSRLGGRAELLGAVSAAVSALPLQPAAVA